MIIDHINKYWDKQNGLKAIVLHTDLGTYKSTYDWLFNGSKSASYNYYVKKNGEVHEWVHYNKQAWHAGVVFEPTTEVKALFGNTNPNKISVGICYEGKGTLATTAQVKSIANLIKQFSLQHLPIFSHHEITSYKPLVVTDCVIRVENALKEGCTMDKFTILEMWVEIRRRVFSK